MKNPGWTFTLALLLAAPGFAADMNSVPASDPSPRPELYPVGANAEYSRVVAGESAPDFSYQQDGRWLRLRDLRAQGHVLLVLGANDEQLRALESQRGALLRMGVVPVAILDRRAGGCRALSQRLGLHFPVIADPTRTISAQFNALEPRTRLTAPAWFVVDRGGRVRGLDRFEWPETAWSEVASGALGLPADGATRPTSAGGH